MQNLPYLVIESRPETELTLICSSAFEVQIPPFASRQFPELEGNSHFSMRTEGQSIVLQMLRPLATGVKVYFVDSTLKFGGGAGSEK